MTGSIPSASFRLEHTFAVKPDLTCDEGPDRGILMGRVSFADTEAIYLGKHAETSYRNVWLDTRGAHALYVMGKRRSGKSFTLGVLAEGLAVDSWIHQGGLGQGVLLLDTMNVYLTLPFGLAETLPASSPEVGEFRKWQLGGGVPRAVLFHPAGTMPPSTVQSQELTLRASDLGAEEWCGVFGVDPFADPLGHIITEVYGKVALDGYEGNSGHLDPNPLFQVDDLLSALDADEDLKRYHRDTREALRRRLQAVRRLPIFSDRGLDVLELVRPGQISVLLLRDIDPELRATLVALIIKQIMQLRGRAEQEERMAGVHDQRAARARESGELNVLAEEELLAGQCRNRAREGLPRSWVIIDEAHNYIPAVGVTPARKPLKKYVDEGRNLGLSIVVATQNPAGLDPSIQRNADMLLIHSLSRHDDIAAAEGMINTAAPSEVTLDSRYKFEGSKAFENLVRALPVGYALAATDRANRLFPVRVRPRITVHGGSDY